MRVNTFLVPESPVGFDESFNLIFNNIESFQSEASANEFRY